tara:strand:+ start:971 stop:1282 length:312 start_codon:yes stop_codon:yes gene_type:complete
MYIYDGEEIPNIIESRFANLLVVKSITQNFSAGVSTNYSHESFSNINNSFRLLPAIEYNIFPYKEVNEHQLRFLYGIGGQYNNYIDSTIFYKTTENYFSKSSV